MIVLNQSVRFSVGVSTDPRVQRSALVYLAGYTTTWIAYQLLVNFGKQCIEGWKP